MVFNQLKYNQCIDRIEAKDRSDALKLIYEWVKSNHINFVVFKRLVKRYIKETE